MVYESSCSTIVISAEKLSTALSSIQTLSICLPSARSFWRIVSSDPTHAQERLHWGRRFGNGSQVP